MTSPLDDQMRSLNSSANSANSVRGSNGRRKQYSVDTPKCLLRWSTTCR